jgi:tRNA G18 (ribose-2'-O)-methylase SpoU
VGAVRCCQAAPQLDRLQTVFPDTVALYERMRRRLSQGIKQRAWEQAPQLDPPAVLADVVLVLVGPKNPANVGTIARSCSAFECLQMRIVESRCEHTARWVTAARPSFIVLLLPATARSQTLHTLHNPCHTRT